MQASSNCRNRRQQPGSALISALVFTVITAICLAGIGTLSVSHYNRASVEGDYAAALNLAEAGINYELRKISRAAATADQAGSGNPPGTTLSFGGGTFRVYCANRDGSTPWTSPNPLTITATGTLRGVSRTVRVTAKGYSTGLVNPGNYALFGVLEGIMNGTPTTVSGDVGTNGFFTFNGSPTVTGQVIFNGPGSDWQCPPFASYNVSYKPQAVTWPTVDQIANQTFPSGGLTWLATHNDNALAVPPISNNFVLLNGTGGLTLKGKAGGANYYLTSLTCNGSVSVTFDNTAGPINVWMGPSGQSGTCVFNGGTAAVKMTQDATRPVQMYIATTNDVILNGNNELDAGIYNVNGYGNGRVIFNGSPTFYGCAICNRFTLNGNPAVHYVPGLFQTGGVTYYGFDSVWQELNPINQ